MSYDVRGLANYVLDFCEQRNRELSNIEVIKIVYFVHETYLVTTGCNLTDAKVEAWEFGPVFREIYFEFKEFGKSKISRKARKFDFNSGTLIEARENILGPDKEIIDDAITRVMHLNHGQLIELSHVPGGPWDVVFNHKSPVNCGMEITESHILDWYQTQSRN